MLGDNAVVTPTTGTLDVFLDVLLCLQTKHNVLSEAIVGGGGGGVLTMGPSQPCPIGK